MPAPAFRLLCALAAFAPPVALYGQADDSTTRGYAPAAPRGTAAEGADMSKDALATARAILQPGRSDADVSQAGQLVQAADSRIAALGVERKKPGATLSKAERDSLDAERKAVNRRKVIAQDLVTLADLEREAANKARDAAIARQHALEMEGLFVRKKQESGDNATANTGAGETLRELGRETLAAQKQAAALDRDLASKRALVASKRLDLFQSYLSSRSLQDR